MPHALLKREHLSLTDSSILLATKIALVAINLSISMTNFDTGKSPILTSPCRATPLWQVDARRWVWWTHRHEDLFFFFCSFPCPYECSL